MCLQKWTLGRLRSAFWSGMSIECLLFLAIKKCILVGPQKSQAKTQISLHPSTCLLETLLGPIVQSSFFVASASNIFSLITFTVGCSDGKALHVLIILFSFLEKLFVICHFANVLKLAFSNGIFIMRYLIFTPNSWIVHTQFGWWPVVTLRSNFACTVHRDNQLDFERVIVFGASHWPWCVCW